MPDIVDSATRSRMMSGIRGKNTRPELLIRSLLHRNGFRFRLHVNDLPGRPDIVMPRHRCVVLVNGCFWHGHNCALFKWPGTRIEWWRNKIERNRMNDGRSQEALLEAGWRIAVVWECAIKGRERIPESDIADTLTAWLRSSEQPSLVIRGRPHEPGNAG